MTRVNRAVEKGETAGFMKVLVDAESERIVGASLFGVGADEVVHSLLATMYADTAYSIRPKQKVGMGSLATLKREPIATSEETFAV